MTNVRIGVIGCGAIATAVHLPTLVGLRGVSVVSVADPALAAREAAQRIVVGARAFDSAQELLDAGGLDAVVLAMPSPLHASTAIAAFAAGYHVYVEKPVATTVADAQALLASWQRAQRVGVVGFNYRQHPLVQQAHALLRTDAIGEVVALQTNFTSRPDTVPVWKQQSSGGALFDKGAHHIDIAAYLLGAYPEAVSSRVMSRRTAGDTATLECLFPNGVTMQSTFSFDATADDRVTVVGRDGRLSFDRLAGLSVERSRSAAERSAVSRARTAVSSLLREPFARSRLLRADAEPSFRRALCAFSEAVRAWPTPVTTLPTLADGVRCVAVLLAAAEAAEQGTRVPVRDLVRDSVRESVRDA
ncbi:Gfo/Idh/MocA family protein [Gemmatimonas groenlandica]|uniref:Gfo/Idh/MocA family oxidoreductase n=1 Tax=Gemmatimonas groenlandica TaxID=2732249 RepID=A0A6M4ILZ2_9BACT|nr:Gfo/Idh/MocA family oxidoreductase [Gemmatimonas groenlandica]QJR34032.1 Gfo/Idh/MocA family oxidoreductase [Gemmatimonas groenlandica]